MRKKEKNNLFEELGIGPEASGLGETSIKKTVFWTAFLNFFIDLVIMQIA